MNAPTARPRAALLALCLSACALDPEAPAAGPAVYVGHIDGSDALVAVVTDGDAVFAYTCGGASSWQTHTGWFHPVLDARVASRTIPTTRAASGLELRGAWDSDRAEGTLRLTDGRSLTWRAARAHPGAGLFTRLTAVERAGLVVANDGAMAGVAARADGDGARTASVITAPPPLPSVGTVTGNVTGPSGLRVDLELSRTTTPAGLQVSPDGPVIVVLLHGTTSQLDKAASPLGLQHDADLSALHGTDVPRPHPGSRLHARLFWGAPFVSGLLSGRGDGPLFTLGSGSDVTKDRFLRRSQVTTMTVQSAPPPAECDLDDFIVNELPAAGRPPRLSTLLARRDAGLDFTRQVIDTADQLHACVAAFERRYNVKPGLVFVGVSGGALVARAVFSNPLRAAFNAAGAPGLAVGTNPHYDEMGPDGRPSARVEMDFLRDRTLFAVTLAAPHEGSDVATFARAQRARLESIRAWLDGGALEVQLGRFGLREDDVRALRQAASALAVGSPSATLESPAQTVLRLRAPLLGAIDDLLAYLYDGSPFQAQLTRPFWRAMNLGPLDPNSARRSAASLIPGTRNALIPIYAAGARSPGADVFDTLDPVAIARDMVAYRSLHAPRRALQWLLVYMLSDGLMRVTDSLPRPLPQLTERLDQARVVAWRDEVERMLRQSNFALDVTFEAAHALRGDTAHDRMIDFLSNRSGARLEQLSLVPPVTLRRQWRIERRPVPFVVPALRCTANGLPGATLPLVYPQVLTALVRAHGSIDAAQRALAALDPDALRASLGALAGVPVELVAQLGVEFSAAATGASGACRDLRNWRLGTTTRSAELPLPTEQSEPARDGLVDHDGLVAYDSALALTLGRDGVGGAPLTPEFFDHTRMDARVGTTPAPGSWYRRYTSALEGFNHDVQRVEVGLWIRALLAQRPGPLPAPSGDLSVHPQS